MSQNSEDVKWMRHNGLGSFSDGGWAPKASSQSPTSDGKRAQFMFVCLYACMYVCMYVCFSRISHDHGALSESKVVSCCRPVNSTLHRHDIIRVRFLTSARASCENIKKDCFLEGAFKKLHVNFSSSILSVRKTGVTEFWSNHKINSPASVFIGPCLRLNHGMHAITNLYLYPAQVWSYGEYSGGGNILRDISSVTMARVILGVWVLFISTFMRISVTHSGHSGLISRFGDLVWARSLTADGCWILHRLAVFAIGCD